MSRPHLLERLVDFERCGTTAIERFEMRMDAYQEIKRLRRELAEAKEARGELHKQLNGVKS